MMSVRTISSSIKNGLTISNNHNLYQLLRWQHHQAVRQDVRFRSCAEPIERRTVAPTPSGWAIALTALTTEREVGEDMLPTRACCCCCCCGRRVKRKARARVMSAVRNGSRIGERMMGEAMQVRDC